MTKQYIKHLYERGMIDDNAKETLLNELIDTVQFDDDSYTVVYNGIAHSLPKKAYLLLSFLFKNRNKYHSQDTLVKLIWEDGVIVGQRTIDVHICKIRKKFPGIPIKSLKRVGYGWMD